MKRVAASIAVGLFALTAVSGAFAQTTERRANQYERSPYDEPGGYRYYGDGNSSSSQYDLFVERFGSYGNTPDFDNRNFWERLQSAPGSATVGVSGL